VRLIILVCLLAILFGCTSVALCQITQLSDATAPPVHGVGHNYVGMLSETVNPTTGALTIHIDMPVAPGRKLTAPLAFEYNSGQAWFFARRSTPFGSCLTGTGQCPHPKGYAINSAGYGNLTWGGWSSTFPEMIHQAYTQYAYSLSHYTLTYPCKVDTAFMFKDATGAQHQLNLSHLDPSVASACAGTNPRLVEADTASDSYFQAALPFTNGAPNSLVTGYPTVAGPNGTVYVFPQGVGNGAGTWYALPSSIEDSNGNVALVSSSTSSGQNILSVADTAGRTETTISAFGSGITTSTVTSAGLTYSLNWQTFTAAGFHISTSLQSSSSNCAAIPTVVGAIDPGNLLGNTFGANVIKTITLPNGRQYKFDYDAATGFVSKITYPSGGYVSYIWGTYPQSSAIGYNDNYGNVGACAYIYDTPAITQRSVSFDGSTVALQQNFSYSTTWTTGNTGGNSLESGQWTSKFTTVTTQDFIAGTTSKVVYNYGWIVGPPPISYLADNSNGILNQIALESTIQRYGFSPSYPLLATETKNWYIGSAPPLLLCSFETLDNGLVSGKFFAYNAAGQIADLKEFDYGQFANANICSTSSSAPTSPTPSREIVTSYQSFASSPTFAVGPSILDRPSAVKTYGNATLISETDNSYDQSSVGTVSNLPTGTHDETSYGPGSTAPRGNPTTITRLCLQTCTNSVTTATYDETGQVLSEKDACGNATCSDMTGTNHTSTFSYVDNFDSPPSGNTNAYLTQITDALGHISTFKYAYSYGQLISSKDQNNNTTSYLYNDSLRRLTETDLPDGGKSTISYNDTAPTPSVTTTRLIATSPSTLNLSTTAIMDGIGHFTQSQLTTDPDGTTYSDTSYDGLGRVRTQSNPHRATPGATDGTTTNFYDALGRICVVVPPDGTLPTGNSCPSTQPSNTIFTTYSGNAATVTDQAGKSRKSVTDALGRLLQVFEDPSGLNYETDYSYDALGNLLTVNQKGGSTNSANWRTRTFTYNSLSQLLTANNPESGTITYSYDNNGNIATKVAPAPNQTGSATVTTTYSYDALNRLTQKSYSDGVTPTPYYRYDMASPWGSPYGGSYVGRLSEEDVVDAHYVASHIFVYDPMGRIQETGQCTSVNCNTSLPGFHTLYSHDLAGNLTSYQTVEGGITFGYQYDSAGRVKAVTNSYVDAQHPATLATVNLYTPSGYSEYTTYGNGTVEVRELNTRLQPCRFNVNTGPNPPSSVPQHCSDNLNQSGTSLQDFYLTYNEGTANNGNVAMWQGTFGQTFHRYFGYDSLNRVSSMSEGFTNPACKGLTWTYDAWGNRTDQTVTSGTCNTFHATASTQNRLVDPINNAYQYDAAGNMTHDASHSYTYDAENRLTKVDGGSTATFAYDADGNRIQKTVGSTITVYVFNPAGQVIHETDANLNFNVHHIYLAGQLLAEMKNSTTYFVHNDHLGSARLLTAMNQSAYDSLDYLPFGEQIAGASGTSHKFTGKERDAESTLDNFGARYYGSNLGRFMSVDPDNAGAIDQDPQTWNAYSYVRNNPLRYVDPDGTHVLVCIDGQSKCHIYTDEQYARLYKQQNGQQGINLPGGAFPTGNITCGGQKCGTAKYFEAPLESANGMNFAIGGLFKFAIEGGISLLEGLFGSGARTAAGEAAAGAATNAGGGAAQGVVANGTKATVRELVENSALSNAQKAAVKSALNRAGSTANITVEKLADGSVRVLTERAGRVGSQVIEKTIDAAGNTTSVVQKAYDAAGNLVHVDPKFP
jgi:RHS repeat-associated protein